MKTTEIIALSVTGAFFIGLIASITANFKQKKRIKNIEYKQKAMLENQNKNTILNAEVLKKINGNVTKILKEDKKDIKG